MVRKKTKEGQKEKISVKACPFCKSTDLQTMLLEWGGTPAKYNCNSCGRVLPFTIELSIRKTKLKKKAL